MFKAVLPELTDNSEDNISAMHNYLEQLTKELEIYLRSSSKNKSDESSTRIKSKARLK